MSKIRILYNKSVNRWGKRGVIIAFTLAMVLFTAVSAVAMGYVLYPSGTVQIVNDAVFIAFSPVDPTGTGLFNSFLRVSSANSEVVQGYNTDADPQFDEDNSWTDSIALSDVPYFLYEGELYREFQLDINQTKGNNLYTLDVVQVWLGGLSAMDITGFTPPVEPADLSAMGYGSFAGYSLTEVYNLDADENNWIILDYLENAGSGKRDMKLLVPDANFGDYGAACEFMGTGCEKYVVFYTRFGNHLPNDDGFEEWGVAKYNTVSGYKWHDLDADGIWDNGEPGLEDWTICAQKLVNGVPTGDPVCTLTKNSGKYTLAMPDGTYRIYEECEADWFQSFPAPTGGVCGSGIYTETLSREDKLDNRNFGNYQAHPAITIDKTGDALSKVGDLVNYTITVDNTSSPGTPALECTITDAKLGINQKVTLAWNAANYVLTPTYTVQPDDSDPLLNTASVSCTYVGDTTEQASDTDDHSVNLFQPSVVVRKTGDPLSKAGDVVTYNIWIHNTSTADSPNLILDSFSDTVVPGVVPPAACSPLAPDNLVPGGPDECNFSYTYLVQAGDPDPLINWAEAHYHPAGFPNDIWDKDDHSVNLFQPSVTIDKTGDTLSKVGDVVNYTITVDNTSSNDSPNLVCTMTDPLLGINQPVTLAWNAANYVINATYTVPAGAPDPLVNTATVTCSPIGFTNVLSASDGHSVNLFQPSVTINKTGDTLSKIGDLVNYTITVDNTSSNDSPDLVCTITDAKLGIVQPVTLPWNAANYVINATYTVQPGDPDPLVNTATVTCSPVGFPNVLSASDGHSVNLFQPSVTIDKTGDALSKIGDVVNYTITVDNTSSNDSPDLVCTITDAKLGINQPVTLAWNAANYVLTPTYTVLASDPDPLLNTATVTCSPVGFPNILTDSDDHSVNLFQPSVTIDKTGDTLSKIGDVVNYTITVDNTSSNDSPNLVCTITDAKLGINQPVTLAWNAANYVITPTYTVQPGDPDPLLNTATVTCSPVGFPNVLSASDGHSVNLFQPSVTIDKTGDTLSKIGDLVNYTITVDNTSSNDSPDLVCTVTDPLLGINQPVTLAWNAANYVLTPTYTVPAGAPDPLVNTATVTCSPVGFPNVLSASDGHSVNLFQPSVTIDKTGDTLSKIGDVVNYTITVDNTSSNDSPNLVCTITDAKLGINQPVTLAWNAANYVINASYTVPAGAPDPLVNTATVTCSPVGFPNILTDSDDHSVNLFQPSVTIDKIAAEQYSKAGDVIHYTITVDNTSSNDSPDLVCTITDAKLGINQPVTLAWNAANYVLTPTYTVLASDPDPLVNTASITCSPVGFPNILTDSDEASVDLVHPAFNLTKVCAAEPVVAGEIATFNVAFANTGDVPLVVTFDENLTGPGCPATAGTPVTVNNGSTLNCTVTKTADTNPTASTVDNTINAHVTLPTMYGLDNYWDPTASDSCDIYGVKTGAKWHDLNGDGIWDAGEPGLSMWKIHFFEWEGAAYNPIPVEVTTIADGSYSYNMVMPGVTYAVCEVLEPTFEQTYPNVILPAAGYIDCTQFGAGYGPIGYEITLMSGEYETGNNFGNWVPWMGCGFTQGYWKNHDWDGNAKKYDATWDKWYYLEYPLNGGQALFFETGLTWSQVMDTAPKGGNAYFILAHQYVAAYLNSIKDLDPASHPDLGNYLADAEALLDAYDQVADAKWGAPFITDSADRANALIIAGWLDNFNNGYIPGGPSHCGSDDANLTGSLVEQLPVWEASLP